ncbi:MAG: SDR family oxidoreductase [Candidatus Binatia bacterium]|jgi:NAD(P)-dependent dehydrogenase (short-subunit alcohol dehydrogenase family)
MVLERVLPWLGSLAEHVVLVTGASSGIGRETALSFARQGASVALAARRRALLDTVAREVEAAGGRALVVRTDVSDRRAVRAAIGKIDRTWGRIDVLVNNAGVLIPGTVDKLRAADLDAMFDVNVFGALFMMQAVLPLMCRQGAGTIINVVSLAGRRGLSPLGGYCASKFALVGLTEALRTEVDPAAIHIGLVMPGVVDTPMAERAKADPIAASWPSLLNMPPEWVAAAVLLATRFRLREISVPPGAAAVEVLGALVPGITDTLIRWGTAAGQMLTGGPGVAAKTRRRRRPPTNRTSQ